MSKKKIIKDDSFDKKKKKKIDNDISLDDKKKMRRKFCIGFLIFIFIFGTSLVRKTFQNDTFYTIKIGELIFNNGIDMMDHFSFHTDLAYTYPHWLYDCFIYIMYLIGGYVGIHISTIVLFLILIGIVFKTNIRICNNYSVAAFATFICTLAISGFATARAQLVSFILFALEICFIEMFLKTNKKKYALGLLLVSLILCNVHVAVWPFYFILYLPYLAEYVISWICPKIKLKKENKFVKFLGNKFILDKNNHIKYLFIVMILSLGTGLITPIGDTPYTYLIKTMLGNSQDYINEHQMITWMNSPFTIIIAFETLFLTIISKTKLRDLFMVCGLVLMSIVSIRHLSLLALVGTICFSRLFTMFIEMFGFDVDTKIMKFFFKKSVAITAYVIVIVGSAFMMRYQLRGEYIDTKLYPVEAVDFIKENIDVKKMRIFNEYNFGSYLLLNDIPVFIDSRADLYTKQFSGFEYDIFDDFYMMPNIYQKKFEFYDITHVLIYKKDNRFYDMLKYDHMYKNIYEDEYFILLEKIGEHNTVVTYGS